MKTLSLVWLRRDLRLHDNTALDHALSEARGVSIIFIFDKTILDPLPRHDRRVTFIWQSLADINAQLAKRGLPPVTTFYGSPEQVFAALFARCRIHAVYVNSDYEPYAIERDRKIEVLCGKHTVMFYPFKDQVLFEKSEIIKDDGTPYRVFTAYKNKWLATMAQLPPHDFIAQKPDLNRIVKLGDKSGTIASLKDIGFDVQKNIVMGGETAATRIWSNFQRSALKNYETARDIPSADQTSHLSVYLRFGNISIRKLIHDVNRNSSKASKLFLSELIWREFFMMILFHFPFVIAKSFSPQYDRIRWTNNKEWFRAWCDGATGFPIVDAGMRQLNATGFMHNRVRMITASFLVKHLHVDWRKGERYFAEKLLDFELSSNNGNWQWAAGTGVDAAPYFRIFNPQAQSRRFDPQGAYAKQWIPELRSLALKSDYPDPIINLDSERKACLQLYHNI
jgi:deoxyribodipyrimidine photo-lyase